MSTRTLVVVVMVVLNAVILAFIVLARARWTIYIIRGTVRTAAGSDAPGGIELALDNGEIYQVLQDENGIELASEMKGKRIYVRGKLRKEAGRKHFVVESWNEYLPPTETFDDVISPPNPTGT
ncbi:hypothetical protein ACFL01_03530 [Planctomycetota bacterium]